MAFTPGKIHVGAGTGILNPGTDDIDLGLSSDGATLSYKGELEPIESDQFLAPVGYYVPGEECTFEMIISEASATKLKYVLGGSGTVATVAATGSVKGSDTIKFGGTTVLPEFIFEYSAPKRSNRNLNIKVRLLKVNISPNFEAVFDKKKQMGFKITLKAICDTTKVAGEQLGYYMEETADVTGTTPTLAVSSITPTDGAGAQATSVSVVVVFNRAIDPASVSSANFALIKADGTGVACTVTRTANTTVTIDPDSALDAGSTYICVVASDVMALDDKTNMAANGYYNFATS